MVILPLLQAADISRLPMKDPSTLELALVGLGTLAVYAAARRRLTSTKRNVAAAIVAVSSPAEAIFELEQKNDEPARGAA